MLTLADASSYFDRTEVVDPDTGALLFRGQIDPFDDAKRDAGGAYRRVLSTAPSVVLPVSRALRAMGEVWLAGLQETDGLEQVHRRKYVLQQAPDKFNVSRLPGFLTATAVASLWGAVKWVKDGKEIDTSSRSVPVYGFHFASGSDVREYDVLWSGTQAYLVNAVHPQASGFLGATALKLEHAAVDATLATRTYDPVSGSYTASTPSTVKALRVRWQSLFLYGSEAEARYREGDCSMVLPAGTSVATKDTLTLGTETWRVVSSEDLGGAVVVHGAPT
jgi:hypothetical protein